MAAHNDLGRWGEEIAAQYMREKGWYIRHRDWRYEGIDLDIVCIDEMDSTLVFVEVKTRSTDVFGRPAEAVDASKRSNIARAAGAYLRTFRKENRHVRYDIISIVGTPDASHSIEHIENAFSLIDLIEDQHMARYRHNKDKRYF